MKIFSCRVCSEPLEPDWDTCPNCLTPVKQELKCTTCCKELKEHWKVCPSCKTPTGRGSATPTPVKNLTPSSIKTPGTDSNYSRLEGFEEAQERVQPQRIQQIELNIGDTLAERYLVKKKIGQGGFGGVYEVDDTFTGKRMAIKVIPYLGESSKKSLLVEYESQNRIKDFEYIVRGQDPRPVQYKGQDLIIYPMELAEKSMREWLEETKDNLEERLEEGLEIFKQVCKGVEAIHEAGMIHLDLKPENILLTENKKAKDIMQKWQVKISDFGLARGLGNTNLEMLQDGIGTPAYMAPEQILAARWKDVTAAADIYALGMILYELIDGDLPYSGTPQQIREKKRDTQIPITALQSEREIAKVAMECLERDKTKRIKSVGEILVTIDKKRKEEEENKKRREKAKKLLEEGKRLVEKNKYEEALKLFKEAEELDKDNTEIQGWRKETEEGIRKVKEEEARKKTDEILKDAEKLFHDAKSKAGSIIASGKTTMEENAGKGFIITYCPNCQERIKIRDGYTGIIQCLRCNTKFNYDYERGYPQGNLYRNLDCPQCKQSILVYCSEGAKLSCNSCRNNLMVKFEFDYSQDNDPMTGFSLIIT